MAACRLRFVNDQAKETAQALRWLISVAIALGVAVVVAAALFMAADPIRDSLRMGVWIAMAIETVVALGLLLWAPARFVGLGILAGEVLGVVAFPMLLVIVVLLSPAPGG